jgi:hypothetical protein
MSLFFIRLPNRPEPEPWRWFRPRQMESEPSAYEVQRQQAFHQLRAVKENYSLERRIFF